MDIAPEAETPQAAKLERIHRAINDLPGPDGHGIPQHERIAVFAFLSDPTHEGWMSIRNITITRRHKLRIAVMRYWQMGLYVLPTPAHVVEACEAASRSEIPG